MKKDVNFIMRELAKYASDSAVVLHQTPFQVLISTVLSQRTKDSNTALASKNLFSNYPTPKELAAAPTAKIEKLIRPAGFFRVKARRIKKISQTLIEKFNNTVPNTRAGLMSLSGVGAKTSACTMVYAFGLPEICVDVHVHRISNRLGLVDTKNPEETEAALKEIVPKKHWLKLNHSMVRFGQKTCLPRNPKHGNCPIKKYCDFFNKKGK